MSTASRAARVARRVALALECGAALAGASIRVWWTPRDRLVAALGVARPPEVRPPGTPPPPITDQGALEQFHAARRVGVMVERVAELLPWHPMCLPQTLATRGLLRRRRIPFVLHLGVASAREMDAHAWITVHEWSVVGRRAGKYARVASFDG